MTCDLPLAAVIPDEKHCHPEYPVYDHGSPYSNGSDAKKSGQYHAKADPEYKHGKNRDKHCVCYVIAGSEHIRKCK